MPKAGRVFPGVAVFVGPLKGDVEHGSLPGFLPPDACTDGTVTDFVDGLGMGSGRLRAGFHSVNVLFG